VRYKSLGYTVDEITYCIPRAVIYSRAVIDEEYEVVVCDTFGDRRLLRGYIIFGVEFSKVDGVDVEGIEAGFGCWETEEGGLRFCESWRG
jgi:hypothetical protein